MKSLKNRKKTGSLLKGLAACAVVLCIFGMTALHAFAAEGEITADTAKIRAQASTTSEVVGSTVKGKKIDILEVVQDSSGMKWYKVSVSGGGYGYIREDLVKTSETLTATSTVGGGQTTQTETPAEKPADTVPTAIGEQSATIKCESNATIRSGASTSHAKVTSLPNGTGITLIGEATDNAGNKWYQLTCSYNNRNIEGYIRSDLIAIGGTPSEGEGGEAPAEGENPEGEGGEAPVEGENPEGEGGEGGEGEPEPVPEETHNDYEIRWAQNQDNEEYDYFLYDNLAGNRMRLSEVMNAVTVSNESIQKLESEADRNKIIIIVLAGVIVLLFVIITILIFKVRSLYYEDYDEDDDEDEEEEEEEEIPVRKKVKRRIVEEEEEPVPVRRKKPVPQREEAAPRRDGQARREGERTARPKRTADPELHAAEKKEAVKRPASRKPQNFLVDDDEFEFEFLNMDDKDM
ncbi:MAG: SH3 domain-containing protein [Lachnospiraceae bacterium]|nr:SH3 domain-containing protein [Lachnospiraceae bacterium]